MLDYSFIRRTIDARVARGHVGLQETLCDELLALMLEPPQVKAARVSTEKPDIYPGGARVGVEVFAMKGEGHSSKR